MIIAGVEVELVGNEMVILGEIANKKFTRKHIAQSYALALRSQEAKDGLIDWKKINQAIIARWSVSAVYWIKEQAWSGKCFADKKAGLK
jgi:hypothetical protein